MCVLEAMALGTPIVSTPTDGVKECVEEGKSGFLADNDNTLADKLVQLISDVQTYQRMSDYAKQVSVEINDTQTYCTRLMQAYGK